MTYIVTDQDRAALKKAIFDDVKNTRGVSRRAPGLFQVTDTMRKALRAEIKFILEDTNGCDTVRRPHPDPSQS